MATTTATTVACPLCGEKGGNVKPLTLQSLLKDEFVTDVRDVDYKFCNSTNCEVVYFADNQQFSKDQLKVAVGVKEITGERPLCYCFGHSVASIKADLSDGGITHALEDIRQKMKDLGCRCDTENPSGSCCLRSVTTGIETAKTELDDAPTKPPTHWPETFTKVGTVLSAIMASSCCWLPLLLLGFGVSGAEITSTLDEYRPIFFTLTFGFLAAAFYFTYRPRKASRDDCTKSCCPASDTPQRRWFNIMTMNKVMLWVVTGLVVLFLLFPNYVSFLIAGNSQDDNVATADNPLIRQTTINVDGMSCEGCAVMLKQSVEGVPGVLAVKVNYNQKKAVVSTESCCAFPKDAVFKAIQDAGFAGEIGEDENK